MSSSPADFNAKVIEGFHANDGVVGGPLEGMPVLLLHHTGAKTGTARINPLAARPRRTIRIFASKAGAPSNPDWYYNLKANPNVKIEVWTETLDASPRRPRARSATASTTGRPNASPRSPNTPRRPGARDPRHGAHARLSGSKRTQETEDGGEGLSQRHAHTGRAPGRSTDSR